MVLCCYAWNAHPATSDTHVTRYAGCEILQQHVAWRSYVATLGIHILQQVMHTYVTRYTRNDVLQQHVIEGLCCYARNEQSATTDTQCLDTLGTTSCNNTSLGGPMLLRWECTFSNKWYTRNKIRWKRDSAATRQLEVLYCRAGNEHSATSDAHARN